MQPCKVSYANMRARTGKANNPKSQMEALGQKPMTLRMLNISAESSDLEP